MVRDGWKFAFKRNVDKDVTLRLRLDHRIRSWRPEDPKEFSNHEGFGTRGRPKRLMDIFDEGGLPLFTLSYFGVDDQSIIQEVMTWAAEQGGVRYDLYEGPGRRYECCGTNFTERTLTNGSTVQYWMEYHGWRADGPDGWHYRVIRPDGTIQLEQVAPDTSNWV